MDADNQIRAGMTVRTAAMLEPWDGPERAAPTNVRQRRPNAVGVVHRRALMWPDGCWYVQHEGDAVLTIYRERELTPEPAATTDAERRHAEPAAALLDFAKVERLFGEVAAKRAALVEVIEALAAEIPDVPPWSMLRAQATTEANAAAKIAVVARWRETIAEIQRPKGPAIRVVEGHGERMRVVYTGEFSHRTKTRIVLRGESRFTLEGYERGMYDTGRRIHPDDLPLAQTTDWQPPKPTTKGAPRR